MASVHEIAVGVDTGAFEKGVKTGIIKPLEDADKTLDDLGRNHGPEQLERGMKDAQDATEKLDKEIKDTARDIEREFRDAYRSVGRSADDGLGKVKRGAQEVQSEVGQNMGQAFSSFRGDIEDVGQIGQDTLGGLASTVAGMGPAGIVAGAGLGAAAAAVGVVTDAFNKAKEASDEAKESAYEYGITVAQSGEFAGAAQRLNELTGSIEGLKKVQDIATISGWQQKDVLSALATGQELPQLAAAFDKGANSTSIATGRALELQGVLEGTAQGFKLSATGADLQAESLYDLATAAGTASGEVDDLGNAVVTMPDGKKVVLDVDTRTAYEDVDTFEKKQVTVKVAANTSGLARDIDSALAGYRVKPLTVRVNVVDRYGRSIQ